jgi:alpha-L-rhamnosidase
VNVIFFCGWVLLVDRLVFSYHEVWTLQDGTSAFENHEYKLFRWGEIMVNTTSASGEVHRDLDLDLDLTAWVVSYPWSDASGDVGSFNSSNSMLNSVWQLCANTAKVTSLDTTTDSNTREKLPYEADGFITSGAIAKHVLRDSIYVAAF